MIKIDANRPNICPSCYLDLTCLLYDSLVHFLSTEKLCIFQIFYNLSQRKHHGKPKKKLPVIWENITRGCVCVWFVSCYSGYERHGNSSKSLNETKMPYVFTIPGHMKLYLYRAERISFGIFHFAFRKSSDKWNMAHPVQREESTNACVRVCSCGVFAFHAFR